jgi:hypothetical protein
MNRHRAYYPLDDAPAPDGDGFFLGVNARAHPAQLAEGEMAHAVNMRFDQQCAEPRKGNRILPWGARGVQEADPSLILPYGDVVTAGTYRDPITGFEWLIVATEDGTFRCRPGSTGQAVVQPPGMEIPQGARLIQTYNGLVMLRGVGLSPVYLSDVDAGWQDLPAAEAGREQLPPSTEGVYWQNRLFAVDARATADKVDTVWVSDFGGVSSVLQGEDIYQSFKINQGGNDRLVGLYPFNATTLVAAKERSVYVVSNVVGDNAALSEGARLDQVAGEWGCLAPRSMVQVGADVWLLAHRRGVCSIRLTETNALQGVDIPVSRDIQPIIDRINWVAARNAVAAAHDNRVYFAVPLDASTYNNAIITFSTLTQKWEGYDTGSALRVQGFIKFTYDGAVRIGYVSTDGFIYQMGHGTYDETGAISGAISRHEIAWQWRSRGYGGKTAGVKRYGRLSVKVATHDPAYSVKAITDGVAEERVVASRTKDSTRWYRPYGKAPWVATNENDDFNDANREDYSWIATAEGMEMGDTGVGMDIHQEVEETWKLSSRGQHLQIEMNGTEGRAVVNGIKVEVQRAGTREGTQQ